MGQLDIYKEPLLLLTDLYQLTMSYGYWKCGRSEDLAVFNLFFRKTPFKGGYAVACGLEVAIDYLKNFEFSKSDIEYLATLKGNDEKVLFEKNFLSYLEEMKFECDIDAVPEGTVVFPNEPLIRVKGPIIQCQILETFLLNSINFQTLVATKAARIATATQGEPVLEFGLRRAQGIDGAIAASRSAYIGGCSATSNVYAGKILGIPVKGTHAHSWVMSFDTEEQAFEAYAEAMPNNCVFLVDTYDTINGVKQAVEMGKKLRAKGHEMVGVRLDSGDLAMLSIEARKILDENGFEKAAVVASNDLDEWLAQSLKMQGAKINIWGIGTKLVTAYDQPALGGVYKLAALKREGEDWKYKVKLSEQAIKVSNPGVQQVLRFEKNNQYIGDMVINENEKPSDYVMINNLDQTKKHKFDQSTKVTEILEPIFRQGECVYQEPTIQEIQQRAKDQLGMFQAGVKRFENPQQYPVGLEVGLNQLKRDLMEKARQGGV